MLGSVLKGFDRGKDEAMLLSQDGSEASVHRQEHRCGDVENLHDDVDARPSSQELLMQLLGRSGVETPK